MSRWFRHYAGMMRDEKLVAVAIRSKQPVHLVVWVWGAILESAAEKDDAGLFELDAGEAAYFLRADEADIRAVLDALADAGRVADGRVVKWGDRQYQSDKSAERQARYRERRRSAHGQGDDQQTSRDVTSTPSDGVVTPQETEADTDSETERSLAPSVPDPEGARVSFEDVVEAYPRDPGPKIEIARKAFDTIAIADRQLVLAGAMYTAKALAEDSQKRGRSIEEGSRFVTELHNFLNNGEWRGAAKLAALSEPSADLAVIEADSADFEAIKRLRISNKRPAPFVPDSGRITVQRAELDQARAQAVMN